MNADLGELQVETPATRAAWHDTWPTSYGPLPLPDDRPPLLGPYSERHERSRAAFERLADVTSLRYGDGGGAPAGDLPECSSMPACSSRPPEDPHPLRIEPVTHPPNRPHHHPIRQRPH